MPYISQELRTPYVNLIDNATKIICSEVDFQRADLLGWFTQEIFCEFAGVRTSSMHFQSFQDADKISKLSEIVKTLATRLLRDSDLFSQSGELNFIISAVIYGVLGDSLHAGKSARYGFRVYVKGILESISAEFDKRSSATTRREIISKGIISDIIDEMYRRKTSPYEDEKIISSGDLWPLKSMSIVEIAPYQGRVQEDFLDEEVND